MEYVDRIEQARDAVAELLDLDEIGIGQYSELQKLYFKLEYMRLPRVDDHGFGTFAPSDHTITEDGEFVDFGGVRVVDPKNPFTDHAITIDHIVDADGDVRVTVNGVEIDEIGTKVGSYIR